MSSQAQLVVLGDRYEILTPIGSGSAADVFRVRDRRSGAMRAAKILKPENAADSGILARFEDEFRILRTLHHPHLPEVYDYGWTEDGGRFLIMELVDGGPLDEYFRSNPGDIWTILYELCETLTFVHNHNLLHQDIKPSNILVRRTTAFGPDLPLVKLIDFGLTYRRDAGAAVELVGTPEYMSPEVVRGETPLTRAVDYYSLGVTLYELLCGRPPFVGPESQVMRAHLQREPVIQDEELEWAELYPHVRALLTKDWRKRLEAFEELRRAVTSRLTGGIESLDRAYGLARIDSLPMIGKEEVWGVMVEWLEEVRKSPREAPVLRLDGEPNSGFAYMADALRAEASIARIAMVRLGSRTSVRRSVGDLGAYHYSMADLEDPVEAYQALLRNCGQSSVVVWIDYDAVNEKEASFVRYVEAMRGSSPGVALVYCSVLASDKLTGIGQLREIRTRPLLKEDYLPVVNNFRGSIAAEDIKLLAAIMTRANTSGELVPLLRSALQCDALTFRAGQWVARSELLQALGIGPGKNASTAQTIIESLPEARRRLIACISCADYPVPTSWLPSILNSTADLVESDLQALAVRRLVTISDTAASMSVSPSNALIRAVSSQVGRKHAEHFHRALARHLESSTLDDPTNRLLSLAVHYEQVGNYRRLATVHLTAVYRLRESGVVWEADREFERGLEWFAGQDAESKYAGAGLIHRLYVKRYLDSLWSRNLYARARLLLHETYVSRGTPVPMSFWPKYVRSTLDVDGPQFARELLRVLPVSQLSPAHELRLLMSLEDTLVSFQEGNHDRALNAIRELKQRMSTLAPRHRHRLRIYEAMCIQSFGERTRAATLLRRELAGAVADGSVDEAVLIQAMCAATTIYQGDTAGGLRQVAQALRMARRHRLYLRANLLYRLAAANYAHMGKYQRAIRAQMRAIQSAYTIGMTDLVAIGWQRLAEYHRAIGMFGSAYRFVERAHAVLADSTNSTYWSQVNRLRYEIGTILKSDDRHELPRRRKEWWQRVSDVSELGNVELALGNYYQREGELARARFHFVSARELAIKAGMPENATVAAGAEMRILYELGWSDRIDNPFRFVMGKVHGRSSIGMKGERCVVEIRAIYMARSRRHRLAELAAGAKELWSELESAQVRIEIALMLFRMFARDGKEESARTWADQYVGELRKILSNLTDPAQGDGVAHFLGVGDAIAEIDIFMKRSRREMKAAHGGGANRGPLREVPVESSR